VICISGSFRLLSAELKQATIQAFQRYVDRTEALMPGGSDPNNFLQMDLLPDAQKASVISRLQKGDIVIESVTTRDNGLPLEVPGGLVHHWRAIAFIAGATAQQTLNLEQEYSRHAELYKPDVQAARIASRDGQHFRVYYRFYRHAIVSVVYNTDFDVDYFIPDIARNYSVAKTVRIAELSNPGKSDEKEYPVGHDHGYMWRLNLYTRCVERDGGVYIQIEFLALSRSVPAIFAFLVNPYVHSIPRDYLKHYLETTRKELSPVATGIQPNNPAL
jgi:hypothetical protein